MDFLNKLAPRQPLNLLLASIFASLFLSAIFSLVGARPREPYSVSKLVRVGFIGDSILQGNNLAERGNLITALTDRELTWTRAIYPHFNIDTWIDLTDRTRHFDGLNAGYSGETVAQVLARVDQPTRFGPKIMIVSVGINSVLTGVGATSIEADLQTICEHYLKAGIAVILSNIRPVGTTIIPDESPKLLVRADVNAWIRNFAMSTPNVEFWDVASAYDDGGGRPIAGYTADGIHPVSLGSQQAAFKLQPIMQRLIAPVSQQVIPEEYNFFPNGKLKGSDGLAGLGVEGTVANGFSAGMISPDAKTTVKASMLQNFTTGRGIQEFRFSVHGGNSFEIFSLTLSPSSFDVSALGGKWVKARCRLKLLAWDAWRGINFNTSYMNWASIDPSTDMMSKNTNWDLEIETMPFKLSYFPKQVTPLLWIYLNGFHTTGEGVAQIEQLEFFQVNDPTAIR